MSRFVQNSTARLTGGSARVRVLLACLAMAALGLAVVTLLWRSTSDSKIAAASVSEIRLLMQRNPQDVRLPIELARRYLIEQRLSEAGRELDHALRLNPQSIEALYYRGLLQYYQKNPAGAMETFEKALQQRPDYTPARLHLGQIYVQRGEFKKALDTLKEYVRQEPMDDSGYYWLGVTAFTSGYEKTGFWAMERAKELAPDITSYHLALGGFCLNSKQSDTLLDKAESELREARHLSPNDWMVRYRLATALLRRNRLREAGTELEEAARLEPRAMEPYFLLPQVFQQLGDREKAAHYRQIAETRARAASARSSSALSGSTTPVPPPNDPK